MRKFISFDVVNPVQSGPRSSPAPSNPGPAPPRPRPSSAPPFLGPGPPRSRPIRARPLSDPVQSGPRPSPAPSNQGPAPRPGPSPSPTNRGPARAGSRRFSFVYRLPRRVRSAGRRRGSLRSGMAGNGNGNGNGNGSGNGSGSGSSARLCRAVGGPSPGCPGQCGRLHLCRYFLLGGCRQTKAGKACKYGHSFRSPHNTTVLLRHGIQNLSDGQLRLLLLQNDLSLLPEVCLHYNKGDGPHGACTYKKTCGKLHACQFYLRGTCRFSQGCKRSHHLLGPENVEKLEKWGVSPDLMEALPSVYRNAYAIQLRTLLPSPGPDQPTDRSTGFTFRLDLTETKGSADQTTPSEPASQQEADQICLYHIRKSCSFQDKCFRVHFHLPYRWQFQDGAAWKDFEAMEPIEKAYCDPTMRRVLVREPAGQVACLDFEGMSWGSGRARRLSTASSLTKPPHFILTTDWLWFWEDEQGQWREYGLEGPKQSTASISSQDLEKAFLDGAAPTLQFKAGNHAYEFDFKAMVQKNLHCGTQRKACRRPRFISEGDVVKKLASDSQGQSPQSIPAHWDRSAVPDPGYKLIPLAASSEEYQKVQGLFQRTMPSLHIWSIQRVQNVALWQVYQWQKEQMKKSNGGQEVDERQLFHGTSQKHVDAICQHNFDWRICGLHGTAYGRGSYFARDASYSHHYSNVELSYRIMFLARVLVGEFTQGSASYLRPPPRPGASSGFFHSCVDRPSSPSVFVVFEKHQVYPEYLIKYSYSPPFLSSA
ncbi:protein mono-ADP-ribosyltransferase PARP12 [Tachyglossus aculeatus]|uniref:protein mono-ADP-ribosyltransferase PARP12 n=1 Tax=Tachyglossus aculeatus TaxID=9261 RepID=UPI0018F73795|nr:protein mono-ADP-ribosyltransferase PARP12 [Tachyglossus aculeatus]